MIRNLDKVNEIAKREGLDICVISYGGSCSNQLVSVLEKNGYKCRTDVREDLLCHCPKYVELDIPVIYIYDNPIKAFLSMLRRGDGWWDVNQRKLNNNNNVKLSHENLLTSMIDQFVSWTNNKNDNILIIKSEEIFKNNIKNKLESFLHKNKKKVKELQHLPVKYKKPKTDTDNISPKIYPLFDKYRKYIEYIIDY